jgi:hypothetical protein
VGRKLLEALVDVADAAADCREGVARLLDDGGAVVAEGDALLHSGDLVLGFALDFRVEVGDPPSGRLRFLGELAHLLEDLAEVADLRVFEHLAHLRQ